MNFRPLSYLSSSWDFQILQYGQIEENIRTQILTITNYIHQ